MTATPRRAVTTQDLGLAAAIVVAAGCMGLGVSGWIGADEKPTLRHYDVGPVRAAATGTPAAGYVIDTSRPARLTTSTHRWADLPATLEVPIKATSPEARLPELVRLSATIDYPTYRAACFTTGTPHPGTVEYPERVVTLNCGGGIDPDHVTSVTVSSAEALK